MNKVRIVIIIGILFLILNAFLIYKLLEATTNQRTLVNVIMMNEFSEQIKEIRNFNQFVLRLVEKEESEFPIEKKDAKLYWALSDPKDSSLIKTLYIPNNTYSPHFQYVDYQSELEREFSVLHQQFKEKLSKMSKGELEMFSERFNRATEYLYESVNRWQKTHGVPFKVKYEMNEDKMITALLQFRNLGKELEAIQ
ncbi:hypothetical protein [Salirhabdus salicampi]|uniref:hypothetical protein n=1 Tax=Salirhabdus salicampi TaxID=476102 RepID=UPI0020C57A5B|nr:hypothetical protein [Salirhabdus salicampi]MCP8615957.1 hypothetical protein [Salirhabdus salicampi]